MKYWGERERRLEEMQLCIHAGDSKVNTFMSAPVHTNL